MRQRMLAVLLILFSANLPAREFPIEIIESVDSSRVIAFIDEDDIDNSAHWVPFESAPPLAVADALKAIREHLAGDQAYANAGLTAIELKPIPQHEKHWHYLVKINTRTDDKTVFHYFIVLMDGKVIGGLREPQAVK
jgi:hypothetical protein